MFVGVDGCKAGWFAVQISEDDVCTTEIYPDIRTLWEKNRNAHLILIDMPIGLQDKGEERLCDREARKRLGRPRSSSVFRVPCRRAILEDSYEAACETNFKLTEKKISKQTWNITNKIREIDEFLRDNKDLENIIKEVHPELCFWALNGQKSMKYNKKDSWGFFERYRILKSEFPPTEDLVEKAFKKHNFKEVAMDDILDALVAAITAKLGYENGLTTIPGEHPSDSEGLPMQMVFYDTQN